jgi:hypothetical protein
VAVNVVFIARRNIDEELMVDGQSIAATTAR